MVQLLAHSEARPRPAYRTGEGDLNPSGDSLHRQTWEKKVCWQEKCAQGFSDTCRSEGVMADRDNMDLYYDKKPIASIPVRICISLPFRGPIPEHLDTELLLCSLISLWVSGVCDLWRGLCPGSNWKTF